MRLRHNANVKDGALAPVRLQRFVRHLVLLICLAYDEIATNRQGVLRLHNSIQSLEITRAETIQSSESAAETKNR